MKFHEQETTERLIIRQCIEFLLCSSKFGSCECGTSSVSQAEKHQEYLLYRVAINNCMESKGKDLENTQSSVWGRNLKRSGRQLAVNLGVKYLSIKKQSQVLFLSLFSSWSGIFNLNNVCLLGQYKYKVQIWWKTQPGICLQKNCYLKPSCAEGRKERAISPGSLMMPMRFGKRWYVAQMLQLWPTTSLSDDRTNGSTGCACVSCVCLPTAGRRGWNSSYLCCCWQQSLFRNLVLTWAYGLCPFVPHSPL